MNQHMSPSSGSHDIASEQLIDAEADSVPQPRPPVFASRAAQIVTGLSLVLIAFNLRPVFSSASALLPEIIEQTGLSSFGAGVLTTLPVVCLGVFAPLAPRLAQRIGAERTRCCFLHWAPRCAASARCHCCSSGLPLPVPVSPSATFCFRAL